VSLFNGFLDSTKPEWYFGLNNPSFLSNQIGEGCKKMRGINSFKSIYPILVLWRMEATKEVQILFEYNLGLIVLEPLALPQVSSSCFSWAYKVVRNSTQRVLSREVLMNKTKISNPLEFQINVWFVHIFRKKVKWIWVKSICIIPNQDFWRRRDSWEH